MTAQSQEIEAALEKSRGRSRIEVALVNNMPSSAFEATEQQFAELVGAAADELGNTTVHLSLYAIDGLERSVQVQDKIARDYSNVESLYATSPDGLIVTGTEPLASDLRSEPYWVALAELINWAKQATASAVVSCLAAHAAALLFDGIEREHPVGKVLRSLRPGRGRGSSTYGRPRCAGAHASLAP